MKQRMSITVDKELVEAAKKYAKHHYTSVSQLFRNFLAELEGELRENEVSGTSVASCSRRRSRK